MKKGTTSRDPHGSIFDNHGYWYLAVKLPGDGKRRKIPLCAPGANHAMRSDRPREMAEEAAARVWEKATRSFKTAPCHGITVDQICDEFLVYARDYYKETPNHSEANVCACALRFWRRLHGKRPVAELCHPDLLAVRDAMIRHGLSRLTVNRYMGVICNRLMPWALDAGHVRAVVKAELSQVAPIKPHRSQAPEPKPVPNANDADVERTCEFLAPSTADMVRVHRLTGMRPCELCAMRWRDVDKSATPWVYRVPADANKNAWRGEYGIPRVVCIGPKARAILERHSGGERPFSPFAAMAEWLEAKHAAAHSPAPKSRAKPDATRGPGDEWHTAEYARAVRRACERAGVTPWSPNQLRHAFATEVRRKFGLDACRAVLGHTEGGCVTDRYSYDAIEDETIGRAKAAVEALG